jgi:Xaa-Pro aminopeptidase
MLNSETLPALQQALADANLDGWLLFDFQGTNPIATGLLGIKGMVTRRIFVWIPKEGKPHALAHAIEPGPWVNWPWTKSVYSSWRTLESSIAEMVKGKKIAMEYSPGDAVPYLDRVPAGVLEMVKNAGAASITSSGELVTRFHAQWSAAHIASHTRAAEIIAQIAKDAFKIAGERANSPTPICEHELMQWMRERFEQAGLFTDHGPNVSAGDNAANPHYEPSADHPRPIKRGDIVLIDLWATEPDAIYADQTWMASLGEPSARAQEIWRAVRDARDAAIDFVTKEIAAGRTPRGGDVDDKARAVITERGFGKYFTHRTGHSIDAKSLHGSGPHLDNLETREERLLIPGVGFSIEPGIYIPGEIGMRSEVNVYVEPGRAVVTPAEIQRELFIV